MVLGCGSSGDNGGGSGSLDCAWLAGDNCLKATGNVAQSCLPPSTATGTMSADGATCTYASGQVVTFTPALTFPIPDSQTWNFTVSSAGQTCLHYQETAGGDFSLTVEGQTFTTAATGATGIRFTCPDGTSYANSNAFSLLSCPGGFDSIPGSAWSGSDSSVSLTLTGMSSSDLPVFDCGKS
jgi:hypothetical protein